MHEDLEALLSVVAGTRPCWPHGNAEFLPSWYESMVSLVQAGKANLSKTSLMKFAVLHSLQSDSQMYRGPM